MDKFHRFSSTESIVGQQYFQTTYVKYAKIVLLHAEIQSKENENRAKKRT